MIRMDNEGRLFGKADTFSTQTDAIINNLKSIASNWKKGRAGVFAGYTYLGQFIAHDIGGRDNLVARSSALDLDSLYGDAGFTETSWPLIEQYFEENGKFHLGKTSAGLCNDLKRLDDGTAIIPEPRNDENLIIAQFHLLMQKFHNTVVTSVPGVDTREKVRNAHQLVCKTFHNIVEQDYLKQLVLDVVYKDRNVQFDIPVGGKLPREFTAAAFRFGHSMVLGTYSLSIESSSVPLGTIFRNTGKGLPTPDDTRHCLDDKLVVDWEEFFTGAMRAQGANSIDPHIVKEMLQIPNPSAPNGDNIAEKNYRAGIAAQLNSAEQIIAQIPTALIKEYGIDSKPVIKKHHNQQLVERSLGTNETPLWLFILLEAAGSPSGGKQLGPLGSYLVCDVLRAAIRNSNILPDTNAVKDDTGKPITTMEQLVKRVKANQCEDN